MIDRNRPTELMVCFTTCSAVVMIAHGGCGTLWVKAYSRYAIALLAVEVKNFPACIVDVVC